MNNKEEDCFITAVLSQKKRKKTFLIWNRLTQQFSILKSCHHSDNGTKLWLKWEADVLSSLVGLPLPHCLSNNSSSVFPSLFLEYLPGITLRTALSQQRFSFRQIICFFFQLTQIMEGIHCRNIIHRDLKPENILLSLSNNRFFILDFSHALVERKEAAFFLNTPYFIGTAAYVSPEQLANPHGVTESSDIYSLGKIILELLLKNNLQSHSSLKKPLSSLQTILHRMLHPNFQKRYSRMQQVTDDILNTFSFTKSLPTRLQTGS